MYAGSVLSCCTAGPAKGVLVLEHIQRQLQEPPGGIGGASSVEELPEAVGWRLHLLAERTPEEMMEVRMRQQPDLFLQPCHVDSPS